MDVQMEVSVVKKEGNLGFMSWEVFSNLKPVWAKILKHMRCLLPIGGRPQVMAAFSTFTDNISFIFDCLFLIVLYNFFCLFLVSVHL